MIIFERSWKSEEVPEDWKKANVTSVFKRENKDQGTTGQSVSLIPGKVMEYLIGEAISMVIRNSQHGIKINYVSPTLLSSTMKQLPGCTRGEQCLLSSGRLSTLSQNPHRQIQEV